MQPYTFTPVAYARTAYPQNFGIPRQPGLVPSSWAKIEFCPGFNADCVRGLEDFEWVWVQFVFHDALSEGWNPLVRPPRLGGKEKRGVFATRSPHRPNGLGLSLLKLEKISFDPLTLWLSGADLLDHTPILDIKPYLPFVEAHPEARSGFVEGAPPLKKVLWLPEASLQAKQLEISDAVLVQMEQSLAQDPRPAFHADPERRYRMRLAGYEIVFYVDVADTVKIEAISHI